MCVPRVVSSRSGSPAEYEPMCPLPRTCTTTSGGSPSVPVAARFRAWSATEPPTFRACCSMPRTAAATAASTRSAGICFAPSGHERAKPSRITWTSRDRREVKDGPSDASTRAWGARRAGGSRYGRLSFRGRAHATDHPRWAAPRRRGPRAPGARRRHKAPRSRSAPARRRRGRPDPTRAPVTIAARTIRTVRTDGCYQGRRFARWAGDRPFNTAHPVVLNGLLGFGRFPDPIPTPCVSCAASLGAEQRVREELVEPGC